MAGLRQRDGCRPGALSWIGPPGAAAGLATLFLHLRLPPHSGASLGASVVATWTDPGFLLAFVGLLGGLLAARIRLGRQGAAVTAVCLGISAPVLAPLLDPLTFRCPAPGLALVGMALGGIAAGRHLGREGTGPVGRLIRGPGPRLPIALLAGVLVAALVPAWPGVAGDEPHYLIVAESLRTDGDLDVAKDYAESAARAWHPEPLSPHYRPGWREGSRYSMHGVGYPALLTPVLAAAAPLGRRAMLLAARWFQALLYALFAAILYGLIDDLAGRRAAIAGTLAATLTAPLLFAPLYLFPETAAMLLACLAFRAGRKRASTARLVTVGAAAGTLPWLGVKYIPVALVLAAMALCRGRELPVPRRLLAIGLPVAVGWLGHAAFTWNLYGSVSPAAVYLGSEPGWTRQPGYGADWVAYVADWRGWGSTLLGYFLDQKEGLFPVAPHWLIAAAGIPWLARRRTPDSLWLLLVAGAHVGPYALSQQLGGQSPPVRPLMAVLWALAVPLGVALALAGGALLAVVRGGLLGAGASLTAYLALSPELLPHDYPVGQSWLLREIAPRGVELWRWAPSWVSFAEPAWAVTVAWTAAAVVLAAALGRAGARSEGPCTAGSDSCHRQRSDRGSSARERSGGGRLAAAMAVLLVGGGLSVARATVAVSDRHVGAEILPGVTAWVPRSLPERAWAEPGGVWVRPGGWREIVLTSRASLPAVRLHLRTITETEVRLEWAGRSWHGRLAPDRPGVVEWPQPAGGREAAEGRAWRLLLRAESGAAPADVEGGDDRRHLGAFLRLERMDRP